MIRYATFSDKGDRGHNEDYVQGMVLPDGKNACFVLCDGLGGHGKGELASQTVTEEVIKLFGREYDNDDFLKKAFEQGQNALLQKQREEHARNEMKTTAVILQIAAGQISWGHIGDSRLYMFERGKLCKRTMDHSVPQMLVAAGEIKEKEIRNHPDRNRLLRVMGTEWDSPKYTLAETVSRNIKQSFLLCTDGFWELIEEKKMEKCLKKAKSPQEWITLMKEIVLKNGKDKDMDNYSAIAVFIDEGER